MIFSTDLLSSILQSFVLTFLAEWGDRSQIATIAVRHSLFIVHFTAALYNCWFYKLHVYYTFSWVLGHEYYWSIYVCIWVFHSLVLTSSYFNPAAGNPQKRSRSCGRCNIRTYHLHICGCGGREHVGIQNLPKDSRHRRRLALPMLLFVLLFLSPSIKVWTHSANLIL